MPMINVIIYPNIKVLSILFSMPMSDAADKRGLSTLIRFDE